MENQKLEACYSEHSSTIFSEMLGEDENYQRLKNAKIAAEKDSSTGWKRTGASTQTVWGPWGFPAAGCRRCGWRRWTTG